MISIHKADKKGIERVDTSLPSDEIMRNILNASKLLEGRVSFEQLISLDIPTFNSIVNNEFSNIDLSYKNFREKGIVNAYTKSETQSNMDSEFMKNMAKSVK